MPQVETKTEYIIIKDGLVRSTISDIFTFSILLFLLYFNHTVLDGSVIIDTIFSLCVLVGALSIGKNNRRMTAEQAIAYLNRNKEPRFKIVYHIASNNGIILETLDTYDKACKACAKWKEHDDCVEIKIGTERVEK